MYKTIAKNKCDSTLSVIIAALILCVASAVAFSQQSEKTQGVVPDDDSFFIDPRDGKKYRTVKIGKQTWMAYNLNYKTGDSWCYVNEVSACKKYGRLYDWNTAMKACPDGWRLPSSGDWDNLCMAVGRTGSGKKLKARIYWDRYKDSRNGNGTDNYGFSALPSGARGPNGDFFGADYDGEIAYWWTSTEDGDFNAYNWTVEDYHDGLYDQSTNKGYGLSVRCVQNYSNE